MGRLAAAVGLCVLLPHARARPDVCAVFFVYGGVDRYEREVLGSIQRLKRLNPTVRTVLVTDSPDLGTHHAVDGVFRIPTPRRRGWVPRTRFLSHDLFREFPACGVSIALDSHVAVCADNLAERLHTFAATPTAFIGANVEHSDTASPFRYVHGARVLPHNFALVVKRSPITERTLLAWWNELGGSHGDDQRPLMRAIERSEITLTRLPESFAMGLKSVNKTRFGLFPRFTYLLDGDQRATLVHSHHRKAVPAEYPGFCAFLNANASSRRMVFHVRAPTLNTQFAR